ncbi:MAG: tRNA (adenine-N1)-methyltransferase [Acidimicrobiia bacterium]
MSRPFQPGDRVLLIDNKRRQHLITLQPGASFHTHTGILQHDDLIGCEEGLRIQTNRGQRFVALRPTLAEYILKMPRGAQVIYPKDIGPILMLADITPGARILESGVGSGALTMALLRAVGPEGFVTGYEIRDDFAIRAQRNIEGFLGSDLPLRIEVRDIYEGIAETNLDRILLDLPEPWQVVPHAVTALRPGGILLAYLPTILQTAQLREALAASAFGFAETVEVLQRGWHIDGLSVRPDHRMVAHTGFLTVARLLGEAAYDIAPNAPEIDDAHARDRHAGDPNADSAAGDSSATDGPSDGVAPQ